MRTVNKLTGILLVVGLSGTLAACGSSSKPSGSAASAIGIGPIPTSTLVAKAKAEGKVVGYGMPGYWADYQGIWSTFSSKYGITSSYAAAGNMSSTTELQTFRAQKARPVGDVGDIGISFAPAGIQLGVLARYKNKYWSQIPSNLKSAQGYWAAAYYGVISFVVNTNRVKDIPTTWTDLLKPQYKGMIGMDDPRSAGEAFDAVVAAAYAFGGNVHNLMPGIKFFQQLHKSGNWNGTQSNPSNLQSGQADIAITWNYLGASDQKTFKGNPPVKVIVPSDGTVAGPYVEVINKFAPHPYAARLLNTFLFSNAGQTLYAKGGAYPVRLPYLKLPKSVHLPKLNLSTVHFLTGNLSSQQALVSKDWGPIVLGQ